MASRYKLPVLAPRAPKRVELTELQREILRAIHEHPEFVTAAPIADHLGHEEEWRVLMAIGGMFSVGLLRVDRNGYHLTPSGALSLGVHLT